MVQGTPFAYVLRSKGTRAAFEPESTLGVVCPKTNLERHGTDERRF